MKRIALSVIFVAVTSFCSGQWLERRVVIGDTFGGINVTGGIVVNPISGNVYIESDPIQIFNPATREKLRGPGVSERVVFCPASGKGYILDDPAVILDAAADTVIGTADLPRYPSVFAYNLILNRLYLASTSRETLYVFDPDGDTILHAVGIGDNIRRLLWDAARNRLYVGTDGDSVRLKVLDCSADTLLADVSIGLEYLQAIALSTTSRKLYFAGEPDTMLVVVSTDSLKVIGTTPALDLGELLALVYNPVTDRLECLVDDTLYVVDCKSDTVRTRLVGSYSCLAVNTADGHTYLGRSNPVVVAAIDTNDQLVDTVPIPAVPTHSIMALTYEPNSDEIYGVTAPGDLTFIVDAATGTVKGEVSYANYLPRKMVHNPAGNKLYLLCPGHDEILVLDSTFGPPRHILGGATDSDAQPLLNPALSRLYVADYQSLRVIDCNFDSLLGSRALTGFSRPRPVMVPYLNRLYVFDGIGGGDYVYAYDCLRDTAIQLFELSDDVPCAVYDPRSNRVFFACEDAPTVRALDPVTDSVVKTFDLVGGSYRGKMALNLDLGRLYYTDQSPEMMFTIDLLGDSVISSEDLPWDVDSMFLNRRLGKLYLCGSASTLVFDCALGAIVDTIAAGYRYAGLMNDRNDKLYLRSGAVVDCRYDSVVTTLEPITPRSMAWDAIDNRVFQATTSWLYVYRDDPYGVEEQRVELREQRCATITRGTLVLPGVGRGAPETRSVLLDVSGRKVLDLRPGTNDVRALPAGVYFVRQVVGNRTNKVVVER